MISDSSIGFVRRVFFGGGSSAVSSSFFRFGPARARVVLVAGAGASLGALEGEHIADRVVLGGRRLTCWCLCFPSLSGGRVEIESFGSTRAVAHCASSSRRWHCDNDERFEVCSVLNQECSCHCKALMRGCRGTVLVVASESAVVGGSDVINREESDRQVYIRLLGSAGQITV